MAKIMEMPKLSDTMAEGSVAHWLKKEGDKITGGVPVVEIDTDKATMEYEAPAGGILLKILVGDGQKCALQDPIAVIGKADENWQEALDQYKAKKSGGSSASKPDAHASAAAKSAISVAVAVDHLSDQIKASPLAKKIAADKGINLSSVQGTGPNGRIVQRDLDTHASSAPVAAAVSVATTSTAPSFIEGAVQKIPHTNMRKTIARRLTESLQTAPHIFLTASINMTNILKWRKEVLVKATEDQKFSINDLVIFLVSRALKRHPLANASWLDDCIETYSDVHMSVAVALPTGLMTPVIRNTDKLSVIQIGKESKRLVKLAKDGKLPPSDYAGGTFTISNLGMTGVIEEFTAIINPPQSAILAVSSTIPTPVVVNGAIVIEERMKVTLSCDHRVLDGAVGAEFLKTLKQFFEDPMAAMFLS